MSFPSSILKDKISFQGRPGSPLPSGLFYGDPLSSPPPPHPPPAHMGTFLDKAPPGYFSEFKYLFYIERKKVWRSISHHCCQRESLKSFFLILMKYLNELIQMCAAACNGKQLPTTTIVIPESLAFGRRLITQNC